MCTTIAQTARIAGSGKGAHGWFDLDRAHIAYDHPSHAQLEHAIIVDLVNEAAGPGARVAVELSCESAQQLADRILAAVRDAEAYDRP